MPSVPWQSLKAETSDSVNSIILYVLLDLLTYVQSTVISSSLDADWFPDLGKVTEILSEAFLTDRLSFNHTLKVLY